MKISARRREMLRKEELRNKATFINQKREFARYIEIRANQGNLRSLAEEIHAKFGEPPAWFCAEDRCAFAAHFWYAKKRYECSTPPASSVPSPAWVTPTIIKNLQSINEELLSTKITENEAMQAAVNLANLGQLVRQIKDASNGQN